MLTFGSRFKKKQEYFARLCPDISLGMQTELRDIGLGQLQAMTTAIAASGSISESTPYLAFFTPLFEKALSLVQTKQKAISGDYFDNELSEDERASMDAIYMEDIKILSTCKEKHLYPPCVGIAEDGVYSSDDE